MMPKNIYSFGPRARALLVVMALGLLALVAPANAQYAGVYSGTFSGPGEAGVFAVLIRADNTGVGIIFDGVLEDGDVEHSIFINPDGSFSFPLLSRGITVTGQIVGSSFTGSYSSGSGTFIGVKSPDTGFFEPHGGFYMGDLQGTGMVDGVPVTLNGGVYAIADAVGQVMLYASALVSLGSTVITSVQVGGPGQVDDNGNLQVIQINGVLVQGVIDLNTHMGAGTFSMQIQGDTAAGTWTLSRTEPLPGAGDRDGDGVPDNQDAFPDDPNEWLDTDEDGIGNNADTDDDNDGIPDGQDPYPLGRFGDVSPTYWPVTFIEILSESGITAGCGNGNYCPNADVTRAQMAVFLERGMRGSGYSPPAATGNVFLDVPAGSFAASFIEQFFFDGITSGCGNNNYCPNADVTRAQMAVFLLRAKHGAGYSPPPATGVFGDVDLSHWAVHWIEQLAAEGITSGCGNDNYCPGATVTRAQMAVFLVRTFEL